MYFVCGGLGKPTYKEIRNWTVFQRDSCDLLTISGNASLLSALVEQLLVSQYSRCIHVSKFIIGAIPPLFQRFVLMFKNYENNLALISKRPYIFPIFQFLQIIL